MPTGRRPVTAEGLACFQKELRGLLDTTRPALLARVGGDDSDARGQLTGVEWRIKVLNRLLGLLDVVHVPEGPPHRVGHGTRVHIRDEDGKEAIYTLVGPDELDGGRQYVSHASPLGRALLGLHVGAWATIERPAGAYELEVMAIEWA